MAEKIQIAFGLHDKEGVYSKYLATTIVSILENTMSDICIHIFHDETVDKEKKDFFKSLIEDKYNQEVIFYFLDLDNEFRMWNIRSFSIGCLFRLYIFKCCNLKKIIYLDCDTLILGDIKKLWEYDINNFYCGVIKDIKETRNVIDNLYYKSMNIKNEKYFNSGVILFNITKIKKDFNIIEEAKDFFERHKNVLFPDQDFLNFLFQDNMFFLDKKFNFIFKDIENVKKHMLKEIVIVHFAGNIKPWNSSNINILEEYYRYSSKIFMKNNLEELCKFMSMIPRNYVKNLPLENICGLYDNKKLIKIIVFSVLKVLFKEKYKIFINLYRKFNLKIKCLYYYFKM